MCVFQEYSPLPAWKMFHGLMLLLRAYIHTFGAADFTKHGTEANGQYLYFIKVKARNCLFEYGSEESLKIAFRHCTGKLLRSISHLNLHQQETINLISLNSKK